MERLDGILGLHVDDFNGGGEGMSRVAVEGWNRGSAELCFQGKMVENEDGIV